VLDVGRMHYFMDKGFYSRKNVDDLMAHHDHLTLSMPMNNRWMQQAIDEIHDTIYGPAGYRKLDDENLYANS
jgi:hypothetical protein